MAADSDPLVLIVLYEAKGSGLHKPDGPRFGPRSMIFQHFRLVWEVCEVSSSALDGPDRYVSWSKGIGPDKARFLGVLASA